MADYNVTDEGYKQAAQDRKQAIIIHATIDAAIQTALHLWTRKGKSSISDMQDEIASRKIALAEMVHAHAMAFWPYEMAFVNDAFGLGRQNPEYNSLASTWSSYSDSANEAYRNAFEDLLEDKCLVLTPCERANWYRNQQKDRAQIMYYADRVAEMRADALNDQRYSRQYSALGLGRGHLPDSISFLEASGTAGKGASASLLGLIGAAYGEYGYWRAQPWADNEVKEVSNDGPAMTGDYGVMTAGTTPATEANINGGSDFKKLRAVEGGGQLVEDGSGYKYIMDSAGELFTESQWESMQERRDRDAGYRSY